MRTMVKFAVNGSSLAVIQAEALRVYREFVEDPTAELSPQTSVEIEADVTESNGFGGEQVISWRAEVSAAMVTSTGSKP